MIDFPNIRFKFDRRLFCHKRLAVMQGDTTKRHTQFRFWLDTKGEGWGLDGTLQFGRFFIDYSIYDDRDWDYETEKWCEG